MRRYVLVAAVVLLLSAPALATTTSLPGGTSLSVTITSPAPDAIVPSGALNVAGTAAVAAGSAVKDSTLVYVLDVSGSTGNSSGVNCDATAGADTVLTCEKEAVKTVNADAAAANSPVLNSGLASFSSTGTAHDVDPLPGTQLLTAPGPNIDAALTPLVASGGTSFVAGVSAANSILNDPAAASTKTMVFLSDGQDATGGTLPAIPAGTMVRSFAIGGTNCANGSPSLDDVAALGAAGSSCTTVTDLSALDDVIGEQTGSTLDSLTISVDGGPAVTIGNAGITPSLPQNGPASVSYTTSVDLAAGPHQICVTAYGTDAGGSGSANACTDVEVNTVIVTCGASPCSGTVTDNKGDVGEFTGTGLDKVVGLRAGQIAGGECGSDQCVAGFDLLFNDSGSGNGVIEFTMTATKANSTPPGQAAIYFNDLLVTNKCTGKNPVLPCQKITKTQAGRTEYYLQFKADARVRFR